MKDQGKCDAIEWRRRYKLWKAKLNQLLLLSMGVECDDLPDWGYVDAFDEGLSPSEALRELREEIVDYY